MEMRLASQAGSPGSSASLPGTLEAQLPQSKPPACAEKYVGASSSHATQEEQSGRGAAPAEQAARMRGEIRWRLVLARHAGGAIGQVHNVREQHEHVRGNDEVEMRRVERGQLCSARVIANTNGSSASS